LQETARQNEYAARWLALDADAKSKVKQDALLTLASPFQKAGGFAAQVIAAIAAVELPHGHWQELIELLLGFINQADTNLKIATLQTIGFICETIVCRALRLADLF
jgi:importin subunit beta-1